MAQVKRTSGRARSGGGKLALFEVIQAAQSPGEQELSDAVAPLVQNSPQSSTRAPQAEPRPEPRPTPDVREARVRETPVRQAPIARPAPAEPAAPPRCISQPAPRPRPAAEPVLGARGPGSRLGLAAGAACLLALVAVAFVAGRMLTAGPEQQLAQSGPSPDVLDVGRPGAGSAETRTADNQVLGRPRVDLETQEMPPATPVQVPANFRRTSGLNYVLVQSYAQSEEDRAAATRDALLQNGIGATIEREIPGWPKRICVIGTVGFERIRNNGDYQAYLSKLEAVSEKYRDERKIKLFDPRPVHWSRR